MTRRPCLSLCKECVGSRRRVPGWYERRVQLVMASPDVAVCGVTPAVKEARDTARPLQLDGLLECLLRQYRRGGVDGGGTRLVCPGCDGFLREPVTVQCGHTYCWHCLKGEHRTRCRLCHGELGRPPLRSCVLLRQITDKYPPGGSRLHRDITRRMEDGDHRGALHTLRLAIHSGMEGGGGSCLSSI